MSDLNTQHDATTTSKPSSHDQQRDGEPLKDKLSRSEQFALKHGLTDTNPWEDDPPKWAAAARDWNAAKNIHSHYTVGVILNNMEDLTNNLNMKLWSMKELRAHGKFGLAFANFVKACQVQLNQVLVHPPGSLKLTEDGLYGAETHMRMMDFAMKRPATPLDAIPDNAVDSKPAEDALAKAPGWVRDAVGYNQSAKVHAKFGFQADLNRMSKVGTGSGSAQIPVYNEYKQLGTTGVEFAQLVAKAQEGLNKTYPLLPGERNLTADGKYGDGTRERVWKHFGFERNAEQQKHAENANATQQQATMEKAVYKAKNMTGMDDLADTFGGIIDGLLPSKGDSKAIEIGFKIPLGGGIATVGASLKLSGQRTDSNGIKLGIEVAAFAEAEVGMLIAEAWIKAKLHGYLTLNGDSGRECLALLSLSMREAVAAVSNDAADFLWGGGFKASVVGNMDDDDYIEYGWGAEVSGGVSLGSAPSTSDSINAKAGYKSGKRLSADDHGGLKKESISILSVGGGFSVPGGLSADALYSETITSGKATKRSLKLSASHKVNAKDMLKAMYDSKYTQSVVDTATTVVDAGTNVAMLLAGQGNAQSVQSVADALTLTSANIPTLVSADTQAIEGMGKNIQGLKGDFTQKLAITITETNGKFSLTVEITRAQSFEYSTNAKIKPKAGTKVSDLKSSGPTTVPALYVKFDNISRLLKFKADLN